MRCARWLTRSYLPLLAIVAVCVSGVVAQAETLGRAGAGWLESVDGYLVLHLKGTPYEMGVQHGKLLSNHVRENMKFLLETKADETVMEAGPVKVTPKRRVAVSNAASITLPSCRYGFRLLSSRSNSAIRRFSE